jgi:transcriptional regulator with PAS, ATPase and Fis domain
VVSESEALREVFDRVRRAARSPSTVLVTGESGTGKELIARAVHYHSDRVGAPLVAANCKAFAEGVFESELFGHEKGSFTGAVVQREGKFQKAHRGTLFLDEISSLRLDLQPKLLRALQERVVERIGGAGPKACDVRVIAATNIDLAAAVRRGAFRSDLYYRLCVVTVHLVPLRRRREDIPAFVDFFCKRYAKRFERDVPGITDEALQALQGHDWPGNIRELENSVQRAMLLSESSEELKKAHFFAGWPEDQSETDTGPISFGDCSLSLAEVEAHYIREVLQRADGNQSQAAQTLQIDRKTLRNKLQRAELSDRSLQSVS